MNISWVRIKQRLPELGEKVLIYTEHDEYKIAALSYDDSPEDGGWGFEDEDGYDYTELEEVVAWMYLPKYQENKELLDALDTVEKLIVKCKEHDKWDMIIGLNEAAQIIKNQMKE